LIGSAVGDAIGKFVKDPRARAILPGFEQCTTDATARQYVISGISEIS
jgi:hypothetical protein